MLDANLWRPTPKISRIRESGNREGGVRSWGQRRKEEGILARHDRGVLPVEANGAGSEAHDAERDSVRRLREPAREIELNISACARASDGRAERFDSDLRLAQGAAE